MPDHEDYALTLDERLSALHAAFARTQNLYDTMLGFSIVDKTILVQVKNYDDPMNPGKLTGITSYHVSVESLGTQLITEGVLG